MDTILRFWLMVTAIALPAQAAVVVRALRCPEGGIAPQAAVDERGAIHLVFLKGDDAEADVYYVRSTDGGQTWSKSLRVNSRPGSAIAVGTVRGAQLALGSGGRPHVAWMGSRSSRGAEDESPMLYARLNDAGDAFEPQRNVIGKSFGLDGGGSVASDGQGHVYVGWHAPARGARGMGEEHRTLWLAVSSDEGKTFSEEINLLSEKTGVCGCCAMKMLAPTSGGLLMLYRSASGGTRDMYLLSSSRPPQSQVTKLQEWHVKKCPMSTAALVPDGTRVLAAWETRMQVYVSALGRDGAIAGEARAMPGRPNGRKHPTLAVGRDGVVLMVWDEETAWKKGGSVCWQGLDQQLRPLNDAQGKAADMPAWSMPAAVATPGGVFLVIY